MWLCRLGTSRCLDAAFICVRAIQTSKAYPINDKKIKPIVINMWQNQNHRYSSHNSNIKCVGSTINCV